jgi:hypothetical protein
MVNIGAGLHKNQFTVCVRGSSENWFETYSMTDEEYKKYLGKVVSWRVVRAIGLVSEFCKGDCRFSCHNRF